MNTTPPATTPQQQQTTNTNTSSWSPMVIAGSVITALFYIITHYGAAKLSYDKFGSVGWAIVAFIFAPFYYVYYAYFISTSSVVPTLMGGLRRRR